MSCSWQQPVRRASPSNAYCNTAHAPRFQFSSVDRPPSPVPLSPSRDGGSRVERASETISGGRETEVPVLLRLLRVVTSTLW